MRPSRGRGGLRRRRARLEGGTLPARAECCGARAGYGFLTRVAVISDTHLPRGTRALPEECVRLIASADLVLHAGDFVSVQLLQELEKLGPPVVGVCGNMDEQALKQVLPKQRVVEVDGVQIGMVHDPGPRERREARLAARFEDCGAVVYGHTHVPQVERFQHLWVLNPGSPTERRSAAVHSMIVLSVKGARITPELVTL
ncbi:MAG: metallophosphatase family protein [Actinomycetota bacterium]|nr:metallophosphatase family protein [Actinomycetota bacterium]